jgi:hypothetical protein
VQYNWLASTRWRASIVLTSSFFCQAGRRAESRDAARNVTVSGESPVVDVTTTRGGTTVSTARPGPTSQQLGPGPDRTNMEGLGVSSVGAILYGNEVGLHTVVRLIRNKLGGMSVCRSVNQHFS